MHQYGVAIRRTYYVLLDNNRPAFFLYLHKKGTRNYYKKAYWSLQIYLELYA